MGLDMGDDLHLQRPNARSSLLFGPQYPLTEASYIEFCAALDEMEESSYCAFPSEENIAPIMNEKELKISTKENKTENKVQQRGTKPQESYAYMIYKALENSESGKLTLAEIYQWIEDMYPYYKTADPVWKNSIRHNLSLNAAFKKIPRPESSKGKGGFWAIDYTNQKNKKILQQHELMTATSPKFQECTIRGENHGKLVFKCK